MENNGARDLIFFLKEVALFKDFSNDDLLSILPFIQFETFEKDDWIIKEGDIGQDIYIIKSGKVEIVKKEKGLGSFPQLSVIGPGEWAGEMGHFEQGKRSASIRALEKVEVVVLLLQKLSDSELEHLFYPKIVRHLTKGISQRLRKTDEILIASLSEKLKLSTDRNEISNLLIHMMVLIALLVNLGKFIVPHIQVFPVLNQVLLALLVVPFGVSVIWLIKTSAYPLSFYGLTLKNWLRISAEAIIFSMPILILLTLIKVAFIHSFSAFKHMPLFEFIPKHQDASIYFTGILLYVILIPIQELIIRSFLQSCFRNLFQGPYHVFFAILTSNLVYEMAHSISSITFAFFSFLFGIFWGYLFERQKSFVGVCISHIVIGVWGLTILNFKPIMDIIG